MSEPKQLEVYVLAMQKQAVILPGDVVAEIIPYEPLQRIGDTPDWFLGLLGWRGIQMPVVSFEMLTVERASFSLVSVASASLVIIRGNTDQALLPFYALVAQTPPQHMKSLMKCFLKQAVRSGGQRLRRSGLTTMYFQYRIWIILRRRL